MARTRRVWDNPIIWREIRTWAYGRKTLFMRLAYLLLFALAAGGLHWMIRTGQLHGALAQSGAMATYYKDIQVYNAPLAFRSFDEVDFVRAKMDPELAAGLEKAGWVSFGFIDGGHRLEAS